MTDKIKVCITIFFGFILSYLLGIFKGKDKKEQEIDKKVRKHAKIAKDINDSTNSDVDSMHDPYE